MSLKMNCIISQRRRGYDLVLNIHSNFRVNKGIGHLLKFDL